MGWRPVFALLNLKVIKSWMHRKSSDHSLVKKWLGEGNLKFVTPEKQQNVL